MRNLSRAFVKRNMIIRDSEELYGFNVDILIRDIIEMLNQKGYITVYCCSGHYDRLCYMNCKNKKSKFTHQPYICFSNYSKDIVKTPKGWYLDEQNYSEEDIKEMNPILGETIRPNIRFRKNVGKKNFTKKLQLTLRHLQKWAEEL